MATLTIRNLDDDIENRLRVVAALHGRSLEEEVRLILKRSLAETGEQKGLGSEIRQLFIGQDLPGLDLPARTELVRAGVVGL
jgi:plasmid stability protein